MIQQLMNEINAFVVDKRKELKLNGKSFLVIIKDTKSLSSFAKAAKVYTWTLFLGTGEMGYKVVEVGFSTTCKEENALLQIEHLFTQGVFRLLNSPLMDHIIKEEYNELSNECISNSSY